MTHFMAYLVLVSAGVGACAAVVETVLRARNVPGRWTWIAALMFCLAATAVAMVMPIPSTPGVVEGLPAAGEVLERMAPRSGEARESMWLALLDTADTVLPPAWLLTSGCLLLAIAFGRRQLGRERRQSQPRTVNGHDVLVTEKLGPAVAGIRTPVVFLPRWVLAMDEASQRLLLAHEVEHVKRRDTVLLLGGAVAVALVPWNPVVWWMSRRLRLAVEQDCDRRVLAANPGVRRYADLLLIAAGKPRFATRFFAAHFGEHPSDLERRIQTMTENRMQWRSLLVTSLAAVALIGVACEAPRPEPVAPNLAKRGPEMVAEGQVLFEYQVEKPVTMAAGSTTPRYPEILRQAGVEGEALVSFVVNEAGAPDVASFKAIRATHELFATSVKTTLPSMRFVPAEVGGKKVKQLVQQPFSFSLPSGSRVGNVIREIGKVPRIVTAEGKEVAFTVRRADRTPVSSATNVLIKSSSGQEVARYDANGPLKEVKVDDVASVEVYKPASCPSAQPSCPTLVITLKPGREGAYRRDNRQ